MNNKILIVVITVSFIAGALTILAIPNEMSLEMQTILNSNTVNAPTQVAFATTNLMNVQALPSNNLVLAQSYYFISFLTPNGEFPAVQTIDIQFPSGFVLTNATILQEQLPALATFSISGQTLIFTFNTPQSISDYPFSFLIGEIGNAKTLKNQISITAKDQFGNTIFGPTLSPIFTLTPVTGSMINPNAVTSLAIAKNAITNTKIANGAVTNSKIASNSINNTQIVNGTITQAKLASGILTTFVIKNQTYTIHAFSDTNMTVFCDKGSFVTGGGHDVKLVSGNTGIEQVTNIPFNNGWEAIIDDSVGGDFTAHVFAICATP